MNNMTYEQALEAALYPLRDHIWVVSENYSQLDHKVLGAFFSEEAANSFIENQEALHPDNAYSSSRCFSWFIRTLQDSRNKFLEELVEKSKALI